MKYIIRQISTDKIIAQFESRIYAEDFATLLLKKSKISYKVEEIEGE